MNDANSIDLPRCGLRVFVPMGLNFVRLAAEGEGTTIRITALHDDDIRAIYAAMCNDTLARTAISRAACEAQP